MPQYIKTEAEARLHTGSLRDQQLKQEEARLRGMESGLKNSKTPTWQETFNRQITEQKKLIERIKQLKEEEMKQYLKM